MGDRNMIEVKSLGRKVDVVEEQVQTPAKAPDADVRPAQAPPALALRDGG